MVSKKKLIKYLLAYVGARADKATKIGKLSDAEWEALLDLATQQGVAPLLYHRLSNTSTQMPKAVLIGLRKAYHSNMFKNERYYRELSEVLKQLKRAGMDVIVLKGAYLAKTVYQFEALRVIGDIDLLVKKADLAQAEKILFSMGYGPTERPSIEAQCVKSHHLIIFEKKGAISIEIHWTLSPPVLPFNITVDMLWEQARPFTVADIEVLSLSPEDLLFHLCFHTAYMNTLFGIRFLNDINNTIHCYQNKIDWELLFERATQWKAVNPVYIALYLAKDWLAAEVPEKVLARFKPDDFNLEVLANAKEMLTVDINHALLSYNLAALWIPKKPFREKLSIFLKHTFPPPDEIADIYHIPANSLRVYYYYLVRLGYLLVRYPVKVWRMLRGDKEIHALATQNNRITLIKEWMEPKS